MEWFLSKIIIVFDNICNGPLILCLLWTVNINLVQKNLLAHQSYNVLYIMDSYRKQFWILLKSMFIDFKLHDCNF